MRTVAPTDQFAEILSPSLWRRVKPWLFAITALILFLWMCTNVGLVPETFLAGMGRLGGFFSNMFPPSTGGNLERVLVSMAQTFAMAFAGTFIAALVALPLGMLGAKNIVSFPPLHFLIRRVFDMFRGIPALIWALILVSAFGLGPFAGVVALAVADTPVLAKLNAEAMENINEKTRQGVRAAGGSSTHSLRFAVIPQVAPIIASHSLYYLESNFRNAAVLGIVGAGGIGFELEERIRIFAFDEVAFIILLYMMCVAILDSISARIRARLA
ncbi:MAG: phosphonate ABC transporter, permease protein PhnE [Pseudomonadota bacterium]